MNQNEQANKEILYRSHFSCGRHVKSTAINAIIMGASGVVGSIAFVMFLFVPGVAEVVQKIPMGSVLIALPLVICGMSALVTVMDLIVWLWFFVTHKDVFCTEDGIYIGKKPYGKTFLAWDQVEEIKGDGVSKNGKYGHMLILAKMPNPKNPEEMRTMRYFVVDLKTPDNVADAGMKYVRAAKSEAADTQQQPVPDESTEG